MVERVTRRPRRALLSLDHVECNAVHSTPLPLSRATAIPLPLALSTLHAPPRPRMHAFLFDSRVTLTRFFLPPLSLFLRYPADRYATFVAASLRAPLALREKERSLGRGTKKKQSPRSPSLNDTEKRSLGVTRLEINGEVIGSVQIVTGALLISVIARL